MTDSKKTKLFNKLLEELTEPTPFQKVENDADITEQFKDYIEQDLLDFKLEGYNLTTQSWNIIHKMYILSCKSNVQRNKFIQASEKKFEPVQPTRKAVKPKKQPPKPQGFENMMSSFLPIVSQIMSQVDINQLVSSLNPDELLKDLQENPEKYKGIIDMAEKISKDNNINLESILKK